MKVDPAENFVPGTAWNFYRCNSAGGISEVSAITSQIEILFGKPVYDRFSQCKHTSLATERERESRGPLSFYTPVPSSPSCHSFSFSPAVSSSCSVLRFCSLEYSRFLRKIKVGRKSFIACLPHRNCCIKRPRTKNRATARGTAVTSLPRGSARITDVFVVSSKHFFASGRRVRTVYCFPFRNSGRALLRAPVQQTNSIPVELHAISRINF